MFFIKNSLYIGQFISIPIEQLVYFISNLDELNNFCFKMFIQKFARDWLSQYLHPWITYSRLRSTRTCTYGSSPSRICVARTRRKICIPRKCATRIQAPDNVTQNMHFRHNSPSEDTSLEQAPLVSSQDSLAWLHLLYVHTTVSNLIWNPDPWN